MRSMQYTNGDEHETSLKRLFRKLNFPLNGHPATGREPTRHYLRPRDIPLEKANHMLQKLNSFGSAEQLENVTNKRAGKKILSTGDAQRILREKVELGEYRDLQQVACVTRIGSEKFDAIFHALSN
ncbi:hypothetical protein ACFLYL_03835 [Chloroflexota bacterium]